MERQTTWEIKESSDFQEARKSYLSDVEFEAIKETLPRHPESWIALEGGPGLFGLHWGVKEPLTIVFMVSLEAQNVYLLFIERGKHNSVSEEVRKELPALVGKLAESGIRLVVKGFFEWVKEHGPEWSDWF